MSEQAYHQSAQEALDILKMGIAEAEALLPRPILNKHWQTNAAGSPAAWRSVEAWFRNQDDCEPQTLDALTDLALMSEALACLKSVTHEEPEPDTPVNLKLSPIRRHQ